MRPEPAPADGGRRRAASAKRRRAPVPPRQGHREHRQRNADNIQVLIGHMGGPFWARRDAGGWSVPKGEHEPGEEPLAAAQREFAEELGLRVPADEFAALGSITTSRGKVIRVWAAEGDLDVTTAVSNTFALEWPKGSGTMQEFPELDRVAWMPVSLARSKLVASQVPFLERLLDLL